MNTTLSIMIDKMQSGDRDFRYMATSDLLQEFERPSFRLDVSYELKLANQLQKLLEDSSVDVQSLAVRCLAELLARTSEATTQQVLQQLLNNMMTEKKDSDTKRQQSVMALKAAIPSLPPSAASGSVIRKSFPYVISSLSSPDTTPEVKLDCVELAQLMCTKFGQALLSEQSRLVEVLQPLLGAERSVLRKRTISCIASVAGTISDSTFEMLLNYAERVIEEGDPRKVRTAIQLVVALNTNATQRVGGHVETLVKLVIAQMAIPVNDVDEQQCEKVEAGLLALQSFVQRSTAEMQARSAILVDLALKFIKFDPNYAGDEEEEMDVSEEEGSEESEEEEESEDYDDSSWKVRRASCRLLSALIFSHPDVVAQHGSVIATALLERFREREESVKLDVFETMQDYIHHTLTLQSIVGLVGTGQAVLAELGPRIVKAVVSELKAKSLKLRNGVLRMVRDLPHALPTGDVWGLHRVATVAGKLLLDRTSTSSVKMDALDFIKHFLHYLQTFDMDAAALTSELTALSPRLLDAVSDKYFKVSAVALEVTAEFVHVLHRSPMDASPFLTPIFDAVLAKFAAQEQDSEIKQKAMLSMGVLISLFGNALPKAQVDEALPLLYDRLSNDIIRHYAVRSFLEILSAKEKIDISCVLEMLTAELGTFLRQNNRAVKQSSLEALAHLTSKYGADLRGDETDAVVLKLAVLVNDGDVPMAGLSLRTISHLITAQGARMAAIIESDVMERVISLLKSPLLQGAAVADLLSFMHTAAQLGSANLNASSMLSTLCSLSEDPAVQNNKVSVANISDCVAKLALGLGGSDKDTTMATLISNATQTHSSNLSVLSLLSIGKIGRAADITHHSGLVDKILGLFESSSEDVKGAASFCLGSITVGSTEKLLPVLLSQIEERPAMQYLLLLALKEVISRQVVDRQQGHVVTSLSTVVPLLFSHASAEEDGVRNAVAECLGKMALLNPDSVVKELEQHLSSKNEHVRATVVTSLKITLSANTRQADAVLLPRLPSFLALIEDPSLLVRRAALISFHASVHHRPEAAGSLQPLVARLFVETIKRPELVRQVQLGPFKHTIDDGLPVRKAAYECLDTLFDKAWHLLDPTVLMQHLVAGLSDEYDIKLLSHLILTKAAKASSFTHALISVIDQAAPLLQKTISTVPKSNAVQQEIERNHDIIRSAVRAVHAIRNLPSAESNPRLVAVVQAIEAKPEINTYLQELQAQGQHGFERRTSTNMDIS